MKPGAVHALLAAFVKRLQADRRLPSSAIDHRDRSRLYHARQVEELIVLAQRLLTRTLGCSLQNRYAVADRRHHFDAASDEFFRREDLGPGEHWLGDAGDCPGRDYAQSNECQRAADYNFHPSLYSLVKNWFASALFVTFMLTGS
jgi:hypothetical protein